MKIKLMCIFLGSLIFLPLFGQEAESLELYAVNSFEGLRVRSTPSLKGTKIGLLEYQETVECLSIEKEDVKIDGIKSKWYKVKSTEKELEGYVFGGYLTPIHNVSAFLKNKKQFDVDQNKILSMIGDTPGIEINWNLDDGIYLPKQLLIQSPQLKKLDFFTDKQSVGVVIKNGKLHYFYFLNHDEIEIVSRKSCSLADLSYRPMLNAKINRDEGIVVFIGERSGGGGIQAVVFDGKNLNVVIYQDNFAFTEQVSYVLDKEPSSIEVKYDYSFPYFINLKNCFAYSSKDISKVSDIQIFGNQRAVTEEFDGWGPLSKEGKNNIVEFVDCFFTDNICVYEGIYRGQKVFIRSDDIKKEYMYRSKTNLYSAISYEMGL